ncbi:MAG: hypothetical protein IT373_27820 [Polyangiaceae bacterium]|nr:hypothetical protein [Polyangiaceae bacterium]
MSAVFWTMSRAAGLLAYALLTTSVVFGLVLSTGLLDGRVSRARSLDVHRAVSTAGLGLLAWHALALLGDRHVAFGPLALAVPFVSSYRPLAVAAGIVAGYGVALVYASFSLRKVIGPRAFRWVHYASFAAYGLATAHAIFAGSDTARGPVWGLYLGSLVVVGSLVALRVAYAVRRARARAPSPAAPGPRY